MEENQNFTSSTEPVQQNGFESAPTTEQFTSTPNYNGAAVNSAAADGAAGGFVEKPVNYLTGTIGALPGVIVGIVLWIIISKLGYIAGIAGILMMLCSLKGFELLGGRLSIPGIIICVVLDLIAVYFAHNISCAIEIMDTMKDYNVDYSFSEAYKSISEFMKMGEFKNAYYHDLIIGYGLTIVSIVSVFRRK